MTTSPPGPILFSILSSDDEGMHRRHEAFLLSLAGEAAILATLIYITSCVICGTPGIAERLHKFKEWPLVFSGSNGGGGGNHDLMPASHGNLPKASIDVQFTPPTVIVPKEQPRLALEQTVQVAPDVAMPVGGQIGDPLSQFSRMLSNGPGGPGGIGAGCCDGIGPSTGPGAGAGPVGVYPAGKMGVTVPQVIFNPEPDFSDEARKSKTQGIVTLLLVVGKDGHTYDIRVGQSLGMGLDEKAIEAVRRWRFRPGTFNGAPVATRIAVQVDFRLY